MVLTAATHGLTSAFSSEGEKFVNEGLGDRFMNNARAPTGEREADAQRSAVLHCLQELKNSAVVIYSTGSLGVL